MSGPTVRALTDHKDKINFLLDSGAFTAWKSGKPIELDAYCSFLEKLPFKPWRTFMLDCIGDGAATLRNFETMRARGLDVVPVFTRGENPEVLEEFYKKTDLVGIGGLVGTENNKGFVRGVMELVGDRKCHWLGFARQEFVGYYKPFSCDSSTMWGATRFASARLYLGNGRWVPINKGTFKSRPSDEILYHLDRIKINVRALTEDSGWINHGNLECGAIALSCYSYIRWQRDVEKLFGTKIFIACAATYQLTCIIEMGERIENLK